MFERLEWLRSIKICRGRLFCLRDDTAQPSFLDFYSPRSFVISSVWGRVFVFAIIFFMKILDLVSIDF